MSRSAEVELLWGGENRVFRLTPVRWEKVQERCDAGPPEVCRRLMMAAAGEGMDPVRRAISGGLGLWRIHDIREVIKQGLIGAELDANAAEVLCREHIDEDKRGLVAHIPTALAIVMASLFGPDDDPIDKNEDEPGELTGRAKAATRSPAARSASQRSTRTRKS